MIEAATLIEIYRNLLRSLAGFNSRVIVAGMLPVDNRSFPGSDSHFLQLNNELRDLTQRENVEFLNWGEAVRREMRNDELFYRDGFHPNDKGARFLAGELFACLFNGEYERPLSDCRG